MTPYTWHPSATQRDVWYYSGDEKRPRIKLQRFTESGNVYWRAEYTSALIGAVKTPGRDTADEALIGLRSELGRAHRVLIDATNDFHWSFDGEVAQ